jgi:hypothetical protein
MTSKLTIHIDNSIRRFLKESAESESINKLVNEALESSMSTHILKGKQFQRSRPFGESSGSLLDSANVSIDTIRKMYVLTAKADTKKSKDLGGLLLH